MVQKEAKKKELVTELDQQVNINKIMKYSNKLNEREGDLMNLDLAHNTYVAEQFAIQAK